MEGWVTEQERDVTQTSIAEELPFLLHQLNKHNDFERELTGTEPLLAAVNEKAATLIENGHSKEVRVWEMVRFIGFITLLLYYNTPCIVIILDF